ncbi:MAG: TraR/DksA family transcriptional regulator [Pseudomonadota bacterium]
MDVSAYKTVLENRRAELTGRLIAIEHDLDQPHTRDLEDQAVEVEGDEVLEKLGATNAKELLVIDAALARVNEGSFGYCVRCGAEIPAERLETLPATPYCVKCAH